MLARPLDLDETLKLMREPGARIMAGGTDIFPAAGERELQGRFVDLGRVEALAGIHARDGKVRIGARVTWSDLMASDLPPAFDALKVAAREIGAIQIQNRATLAGNLCNASPAADGVPPLLVLDAEVELASSTGTRRLPLGDFITGNRRTLRTPDEILTAIIVPEPAARARSAFLKLGGRRYLVISIVMAAVLLEIDDEAVIRDARIAVGACSAVAMRLAAAERALIGLTADEHLAEAVAITHLDALAPIDDIRASGVYRRDAALTVIRRAIEACRLGTSGGVC